MIKEIEPDEEDKSKNDAVLVGTKLFDKIDLA